MRSCCARSSWLILAVAAAASAQNAASAQDYVDRVVEQARREFNVPGVAVAIVKDGKVVLEKGYGVRRLGGATPVTSHSLFRIASNTKAFTTASLAMLVDEGSIRWDDRVVDRLPGFQMSDQYVTHEMTIRDLLCHRSGLGLGAGDLMFWPATDFTRAQILYNLRFLKPASSFRSHYAYDNLLYLIAGQIIEKVSAKSWEQFVKERIFVPLGMTATNASTRALIEAQDVAVPHAKADGKLTILEQTDHDNNAPAGSINSCVSDLAKWMLAQLARGAYGAGKRLFSEKQSEEMWSPQTIMPIPSQPPGTPAALRPNFNTYGLGWGLRDYRGRKIVGHTGSLAGYVSRTMLVPELNLGVVILTNAEETGAHGAIAFTVIDRYLNAPETDWVAAFRKIADAEAKNAAETLRKSAGERNTNSHPQLRPASYTGRYRDSWYGDVVVTESGGKLAISFTHTKQLAGPLDHWQYDTFVARWRDRTLNADAYVTFSLRPDGSIEGMKVVPVSPLTDFSFDFQDLDLKRIEK